MRRLLGAIAVLAAGCTTTLASMEPVKGAGQSVAYKDATPIVTSKAAASEVTLQPCAGPTGRYKVEPRLTMMVAVRNLGSQPFDVSEASFTVTGNGQAARVVRGVEIEDAAIRDGDMARTWSGFRAAVASVQAATRRQSLDQHVQAQQEVRAKAATEAEEIRAKEAAAIEPIGRMLVRNTVEPGATVAGFILVEPPRETACRVRTATGVREDGTTWEKYAAGPCQLEFTARIGNDTHVVKVNEVFSQP